ncbi:MAG: Arm DNA-binding domain-containing protein [Hyphomonadaceae bacterium]
MKLSDLKCRKAKATERLIKLADGEGLFLHVYPNGKKLWRLRYRYGGKQHDFPFGPYPHVSLLEARKKREAARDLLREGRDPAGERKRKEEAETAREETTFATFADLYLDRLAKTNRSAPTIKKAKWIVEGLAADLQHQQMADIKPRDVLRSFASLRRRETERGRAGCVAYFQQYSGLQSSRM